MKNWNRTTHGRSALMVVALASIVLTMALPSGALGAGVSPQATHLQQNWSKTHSATPTPLTDCVLPSAATGDDCYNPGTHLTWTLALDVCTSSTTVCTGSTQDTIVLTSIVALLPVGETYITGSQTAATNPSSTPSGFTTGLCTSVSAPADCATLATALSDPSILNDTYLQWTYASPSLNGHPQGTWTYGANLTAADGAILDDFAVAHYTFSSLSENPEVSDEVFVATPILDIAKTCPAAVENNSPVSYGVSMSNSGHENASGVVMSDPARPGVTFTSAGATAPTASFTSSLAKWAGTLAANSTVSATYGANINTSASSVTNYANYTSYPASTVFIHKSSSCTTQVVHPSIGVKKVVSPTVVSSLTAHTIAVTATVTNTGDDTLFNVTAVDSLAGALHCLATTLAVGASTTCYGNYTIAKGTTAKWSNDTVNATGNDKFGVVVKAHDHASVQILHPDIGVVKKVNPTVVSSLVANTIHVVATVTNTGDATLFNLTVVDTIVGSLHCLATTLAVGASTTCYGNYTIAKGTTANWSNDTVNATGEDILGEFVSATSSASVQIVHPAITVVKVVNPTLVSNLQNNTIHVTAKVTNTGTQTLFNVTVIDSLAGTLVCPGTTLAPGASMNCTGTYVIPKGTTASWSNDTVNATGHDGLGNSVSATANASVQIVHPSILVVKSVNPTTVSNTTNNTINVTAKVTNTGDVTLYNITVVDTLAGALSCPATTLAPGASMNCTGSYVIPKGTPAGFSNDTVTAQGCDTIGDCPSSHSHASVTITAPTPGRGFVTDTNFCPLPSAQFRVIVNNGQIKSTNPGQFYYNVYTTSGMAHGSTLTVTIPFPFVTSGATPAQVFNQPPVSCPGGPPNSNLNSMFHITPMTFGLGAYSPQNFGSTVTISFTLTGASLPAGTQLWFAIHLNYGLKGMAATMLAPGATGCPTPANTGPCARVSPSVVIGNLQPYVFGNSLTGTTTVWSFNAFNGAVPAAAPILSGVANGRIGGPIVFGLLLGVIGQVLYVRPRAPRGSRTEETDSE